MSRRRAVLALVPPPVAAEEWPPHPRRVRARGTGSVYYHVPARKWAAQRPRSLDPRRGATYHETEEAAHAELDAAIDAARSHRVLDPLREPFGAFLVRWLAAQRARKLSPRSLDLYAAYLRWVSVEVGRVPVGELTAHHFNTIVLAMGAAGLSAGYIGDVRATLRRAVRDCYRWAGAALANPVEAAIAVRVVRPERQCWSEAEARRFLDAVRGDPLEVAWRIALDVGLRSGELRGLVWGDYDPAAMTLRVDEQVDDRRQRRRPKSKRTRTVRLTRATCQALDRHRRRLEGLVAAARGLPDWKVRRHVRYIRLGPDGPILPGLRGSAAADGMSARGLRQPFHRAVRAAGVKEIGLHDLRHTAASIMLRRGMALPLVAKVLGHSSPTITARVYAHVIEEMETEAARVMEDVFPPDPDP